MKGSMEIAFHVTVTLVRLLARLPQNFGIIDPTSVGITCRGNTALHVAAQVGASGSTIGSILQSNSLLLFVKNMKGDTPLHVAARLGNLDITKQLVLASGGERENFIRTRNMKRSTALHEAVRSGHYKVAKLLMATITSDLSDFECEEEESLLFIAIDGGHLRIVYHILETFPTCSVFGSHGLTVMHAVVMRSCFEFDTFSELFDLLIRNESYHGFLKMLLERRGPEILQIGDDIGWMAHHYAAAMGMCSVLKLFLRTDRNLAYILDNEGMSALHIAARNGKVRAVILLIEECPDVCELLDKRGRNALHIAAQHKRVDVVRTFLSAVAFTDLINEQDRDGNTACHLAAISEHCESIILLARSRRVNLRLLNDRGMTAYDIIHRSSGQLGPFEKYVINYNLLERHGPRLSLQEFSAREANVASNMSIPKTVGQNGKYDVADVILLVATIIAGMTFTAAFTMPGGYNSSNGLAILRDVSHFRMFLVFNSLAFGCAAGTMLIHFAVLIYSKVRGEAYKYPIQLTMLLTVLSIISTLLAFVMNTNAVLYDEKSRKNIRLFGLPGNIAFFAFIATFIYFFLPLILSGLYYMALEIPDDRLPVPMINTALQKIEALFSAASITRLFKLTACGRYASDNSHD